MYNPSPHRATVTVPPLSALPHSTSSSSSSNPSSASQSSNGSNTASSGFAEALRQLARQVVVGNPSAGVDSAPNPPVVTIAPTTRSSIPSAAEPTVSNATNMALTPGYPGAANGIFPWLQAGGGSAYPQYTTAHGNHGGRHSTNGPISPSATPSGAPGSYMDPYMATMAAYSNGPGAGRPDIAAAVVWQYQRMMMAMYANGGAPGGGSLPNNEAMMLQQSWMQQQAAAAAAAQQHQQSVVMQQLQQLAAQNQEQWDRLFMLNSLAPGFPGMGHFPPPGGPNMPGGGPGGRGGNGTGLDGSGVDRSERGNSTGSAFQPASKKSASNSNSATPLSMSTRTPANPATGQASNLVNPAHSTISPKVSHALRLPMKRDHHAEECVIHSEEDREMALDLSTKSSSAKKPKLYRPFEEEAIPPISLPPPAKPHSARLESRGADMDVDEHFRRSLAGLGGRAGAQPATKQQSATPQPPPQPKKSPPQAQLPPKSPTPPKETGPKRSKIDLELETDGDPLRCERVLKRVRHRSREDQAVEKVEFLSKIGIVPKQAANVVRRANRKHAGTRPARALRALVQRHEAELNVLWARPPKIPSVNNLANNRQGTLNLIPPVEKKKETKEMITLRIAINKLRIKSHRKYRKLLRKEKVRYVGRRGIANRVLSKSREKQAKQTNSPATTTP